MDKNIMEVIVYTNCVEINCYDCYAELVFSTQHSNDAAMNLIITTNEVKKFFGQFTHREPYYGFLKKCEVEYKFTNKRVD